MRLVYRPSKSSCPSRSRLSYSRAYSLLSSNKRVQSLAYTSLSSLRVGISLSGTYEYGPIAYNSIGIILAGSLGGFLLLRDLEPYPFASLGPSPRRKDSHFSLVPQVKCRFSSDRSKACQSKHSGLSGLKQLQKHTSDQ